MAYQPRSRSKSRKAGSRRTSGYSRTSASRRTSSRRQPARRTAAQTLRIVIEQNPTQAPHPLEGLVRNPRVARF